MTPAKCNPLCKEATRSPHFRGKNSVSCLSFGTWLLYSHEEKCTYFFCSVKIIPQSLNNILSPGSVEANPWLMVFHCVIFYRQMLLLCWLCWVHYHATLKKQVWLIRSKMWHENLCTVLEIKNSDKKVRGTCSDVTVKINLCYQNNQLAFSPCHPSCLLLDRGLHSGFVPRRKTHLC